MINTTGTTTSSSKFGNFTTKIELHNDNEMFAMQRRSRMVI